MRRQTPFHSSGDNFRVRRSFLRARSSIHQHIGVYRVVRTLGRSFLHLVLFTGTCFCEQIIVINTFIRTLVASNTRNRFHSPSQSSSMANLSFFASIFSTLSSLNLYQIPVSLSHIKAARTQTMIFVLVIYASQITITHQYSVQSWRFALRERERRLACIPSRLSRSSRTRPYSVFRETEWRCSVSFYVQCSCDIKKVH